MMRICSWNPLSFVSEGRAHDLSSDLKQFDFIMLKGTQRKAYEDTITKHTWPNHLELSVGWTRSPMVTQSDGCSILVNKKYQEKSITEIRGPEGQLQDRAIMARIRNKKNDWAIFSC